MAKYDITVSIPYLEWITTVLRLRCNFSNLILYSSMICVYSITLDKFFDWETE